MSSPITAPKRQPLAESSGIILGRNCKSEGCILIQPKLLDSSRLAPRFSPWPFKSAWRSCRVPWIQSRFPAGSQYPLQPGQAYCKACPWHAAASLARLPAAPPCFMGGLACPLCLNVVCFQSQRAGGGRGCVLMYLVSPSGKYMPHSQEAYHFILCNM